MAPERHTFGLLSGSFRPDDQNSVLRSYIRQRDTLIRDAAAHVQRMQKALTQMNIQLHKVISDITGVSGMRIIAPSSPVSEIHSFWPRCAIIASEHLRAHRPIPPGRLPTRAPLRTSAMPLAL